MQKAYIRFGLVYIHSCIAVHGKPVENRSMWDVGELSCADVGLGAPGGAGWAVPV